MHFFFFFFKRIFESTAMVCSWPSQTATLGLQASTLELPSHQESHPQWARLFLWRSASLVPDHPARVPSSSCSSWRTVRPAHGGWQGDMGCWPSYTDIQCSNSFNLLGTWDMCAVFCGNIRLSNTVNRQVELLVPLQEALQVPVLHSMEVFPLRTKW